MKYIKLTSLLFTFLFTLNCSAQSTTKSISAEGISINYPINWEIMKMPGYPILVKEKAIKTEYAVLCNFSIETQSTQLSLDNYFEEYKVKSLKNQYLSNWKILTKQNVQFHGKNAIELISTYVMAGYDCKSHVFLVADNNRIINFSTTSSLSDFDKNETITKPIFKSISLK